MRKEIKIGIFALVVLFCLYWGVSFLKGKDLFKRNNTYYAYYDNVSGIQSSAPIMIQGINVGSVTRIEFKPELNNTIELQLSIKSKYVIPEDSAVKMTSSLLGGKSLEINLGNSPQSLKAGSTIKAESDNGIFEMAGSEWDTFKQHGGQLLRQVTAMLDKINGFLDANDDNLSGMIADLRSSTDALKAMLGDDGRVQSILGDFNAFSSTIASNSEKINGIVDNLESVSGDLRGADLGTTIGSLNETVNSLNTLLAAANNGDGTLGMLLNDTALYDSLAQASANLSSLLRDIEANPKRYVNISVFGGGKNK